MKKEGMLKRIIGVLISILVLLSIVVLSTTTEIRKFSTPKFIDAYTEVVTGEEVTATPYVTFDAYFETDGVKYRGIHQELNSTANLVINLNVQTNGTLKDGKITFDDGNYTMITNIDTDDYISSVTSSNIKFSDIPLGVNKTINVTLKQNAVNLSNFYYLLNNLSNTNKLTFTGTHVATDGTETEITKDVYFNIDWYGDIKIHSYTDNYTENKFIMSEDEGKIYIVYSTLMYTNSVENLIAQALDKAAVYETIIPQMQGYDPIDVYVEDTGIIDRTLTYEYDSTTRVLTSRMEANLPEDGRGEIVMSDDVYKQNIVIVYPIEAYTSSATGTYFNAESTVYAEGYSTDEDGNLITVTSEPVANTLQVYLQDPQGDVFLFEAKSANPLLTKANMRANYQENLDIRNGYRVDWNFKLAILKDFEKIIFEEDYSNSPEAETSDYIEDTDHFGTEDGKYYDLDGMVSYEAIKVATTSFTVLGEDGYVNVYNAETNELIKQITYSDANVIVEYEEPVEHIRIETSAPVLAGDISIENYKIIDNQEFMATYDEATFETFTTMNSTMKGSVKYADSDTVTVVNGDIATLTYNEGYVLFEASLATNAFYPQKLNTNTLQIQFKQPGEKNKDYIVWKDATIFVEFPSEFEKIIYNSFSLEDLDEVTITNTSIEEIDGKQVLKIYTSGLITEETKFKLKFQGEIDEFTTATEGNIKVYASNSLGSGIRWYFATTTKEADIYDIDGDADTAELLLVENNTIYYSQVNQLATTTQITDFDGKGTIVEGPNVAKVDKNVTDTARVNILISNGYTDVISNVKIVGRIPFEGNTYVINGTDIGSVYSTTLKDTGIISADGLTNYTVYYSENATANNDLAETTNGWTTTPTDWSKVKSYMIDFGTATLTGKTSYSFYYDVTVPSGLEYGSVTYATHAVYFDSVTASGLSTETDKVGLMFASEKQFNLSVNSYKYNTDELLCTSKDDKYYSYASIYMKGEGISDGESYLHMAFSSYYAATKSELNIGVIYTIKQNSLTGYYLKSDEEISFIVNAVDGELQLEILSGNPRGTAVFEDNTVKIDFENVFKYNIEIRNKYKGTDTLIKGSTHRVNGLKNHNWVDKDGNSTDGSMLLTTGVGTWTNLTVDTWTIEQTAITDQKILPVTDAMNFTVALGEDNEYSYSDLVNLTPEQITYTNTYTVPPKFSISVYNEFKDATVNVHHYLKDTTTSISESVVINGKINDSYTTTPATDIDTKRYKLVSTSGNTEGIMEGETTDVIYYYEEQYFNYTVEYYYDGVKDDTKTETLSAPYGASVQSYPSKKIDGYELEKADGLPLTISDDTTQNIIKVYYVTEAILPVTIDKTAEWIDVEDGIAKITITDRGEAGTEPMDVLLIVDTSQSMIFNNYASMGYSSPCLNTEHWTTGSHVNDDGASTTATANGCVDRLTVTKGVLNNFTSTFIGKNAENRVSIVNFSKTGNIALDFSNNLTTIQSTITGLEADNEILGGTYYEKGFEKAYEAIQTRNTNESGDSSINSRKTVLVFLTDGSPTNNSTGGLGNWGQSGSSMSAEEYANVLKGMGVQIYTNGIGINETDDVSACELLRGIASDGTTDFAITDTAEGLAEIYDNISNDIYFAGENATITDIIDENWVYYEDDTYKPSPTENMTVNGQTVTWTQDVISSEETFSFYIKIKDNEADTYADGTWDTNDSAKLTYTDSSGEEKGLETENPNLTRKKVTVNHYIDGSTTKLKESEIIKYKLIGDTVSATATDTIEGYNLVSDITQTVTVAAGTNEINFYYSPRTDLSYTVEYYLNGTKDDTLTETITGQTYGSTITTHTPKNVKGYMVEKTEGLPLTIGLDETQNVIKVYLVTDPSQTTNISYVVLFYKDGEMVTGESVNKTVTVQYLEHFAPIDKDAINFENRYEGYKPTKVIVEGDYKLDGVENRFDEITHTTELSVLPDEVSNLTYINVYYEKDYTQTKDITYTIEYYKDGVKQDADTQTVTKTIYVLSNSVSVDTTLINTTDKYEGYEFDADTTGTIPTVVTDGKVIKIYYKARTDLSYTVEYYLNGTKDDTLTETITGQTYGSIITTHTPKNVKGYMVEKTEGLPLTIGLDETQNVVKIYLVTDPSQTTNISYVVLFYKDGEMVIGESVNKTVTVQYLEHFAPIDKDAVNFESRYLGYKPVKVEVEGDYKLNGVEYKFDEITHISELDVLPDEVSNSTYVYVYYEKDYNQRKDLNYTIEYYKDGVLADTELQTSNIYVLSNAITIPAGTINTTDKYPGYVFDSETTGSIPTTAREGDVIKIYYKARTDLSYTVEYYLNGTKDDTLTETVTGQTFGSTVSTHTFKEVRGYKLEKTENYPLTIGLNGNLIKAYYIIDDSQTKEIKYKIFYFKNGDVVDEDTEEITKQVHVLDDNYVVLDADDINIIDKYYGYKFDNLTVYDNTFKSTGTYTELPINVYDEEFVEVYYVTDETQTKELSYRINYYKDGVEQPLEGKTVTQFVQVLEPDILTVDKSLIQYNKYDGYKVERTEPDPIPDTIANGGNINIYYEKDTFKYYIHYYYDGVLDDSKTEIKSALYGSVIETYPDKAIDGYVFKGTGPFPLNITRFEENNILEIYYEKRKDLSYTVKYLEQGTNIELAPNKTVTNQTFGETVTENAIDIDGYNKVSETQNVTITTGTNEIIFYYTKRTDLSYTVKYLEQGTNTVLSPEKLVTNQEFGANVTEEAINILGYNQVDPTEVTITIGTGTNEIIFYYTKRTDLIYRVEYYFEGSINSSLTDIFTATYGDVISTYEDKVIPGFKLESATAPIVIGVGENVIRVYYVIDEAQRKNVYYTVEYYKDGEIVDGDRLWRTSDVQYLEPEVITVDKSEINTSNKYEGYKFVGTDPEAIPDTVPSGRVIKVYYEKDNFDYSIEYYYNGVKDDSKTETGIALFESQINTYSDKVMPGYKLEKVEGNPITITSNPDNNVMKVYYVTDDAQKKTLSYKVEYYKEGNLAAEETFEEEVQLLEEDILTVNKAAINTTNKFTGYRFVSTEPETIPDRIANGATIKVNYERDDFEYRVEYFYDGVRDDSKTDTFTVKYGYMVNSYQDKNIDGYVLKTTSPFPFDVTENEEENVLKVYYEKDEFDYTIEYYYDGIKDDSKTEQGTEIFQNQINTYPDKVIDGYVLEKVEGNPITITSNRDNNVMKVFYTKRNDLAYTVKYLEQGTDAELAPNKTVTNQTFGDTITENAIDIDGYNKVAPTTQNVTITTGTNEIIFYYTKRTDLSYRVEYYYNNVINNDFTKTITATYLDVIDTYPERLEDGYKFDRVEGTPLTISTNVDNNVIRVYYVTDESQTKTLSYLVKYFKDDAHIESDDMEVTEVVQYLAPKTMTVRKDEINVTDKYDGYKFEKILLMEDLREVEPTVLTELPDTVTAYAIIEVYYVKDSFEYGIEYYYDGTKDDSKTETGIALFESQINTYPDKVIDGYVLEKVEGNPITITSNEDNNVMKVFYTKRNDLAYTVKYLEQGTNAELAPNKTVTNQTFGDTITENAIDINGYNKVAPTTQNVTITTGTNEIIFYYTKRTDLSYRVEYYYNNVINNDFTETITATYLDVIDTYPERLQNGYKFDRVEGTPLTISTNVDNNVIRVYYVTDESQTKTLRYQVRYFKDDVEVAGDGFEVTEEVQYLQPETMAVRKDGINIVNKYDGYKFEKILLQERVKEILPTELTELPDTVETFAIIDVYYVKDSFEFSIEYYYEGVKDDSKTEIGTSIFESQIDTYPDKVIDGYVLEKVEGNPITITSNRDNNVMKVFYIKRSDLAYTVKYLEQGTNNELAPEKVVTNQVFQDTITENAIDIDGYDKVNTQENITITTGTNEIIFYYAKRTDLSYKVEYYFAGTIDNSLTETITATYLDVISTYTDKVKPGYKYESDTAPITIGTGENVIRVYYVIDDSQTKELSYTVEYYKNGVKADEDIERTTVQLLAPDTMTVDKTKINLVDKYVGYKLDAATEAIPDTVTSGQIIKVYYIIDDGNTKDLKYTVEYYKDGEKQGADTQEVGATVQILEPDTLTVQKDRINTTDKYNGYKFVGTEPNPIPDTIENNGVIKVYYEKDQFEYKVEYYYDANIDNSKTETFEATYQEVISTYADKVIDGYKLDEVVGLPLTIDYVEGNNVIKVYYVKDIFAYSIEYYYNGVIDDVATEYYSATFGDEITEYTNKTKLGYKFSNTENNPMIITSDETLNVMKVFYITDDDQRKDISYKVEYYKSGTKADENTVTENVQLLAPEILTVNKAEINVTDKYFGYKFVGTEPNPIPDTIANNEVIKVYYEIDEAQTKEISYKVEYYKDGVKADEEVETTSIQVLAPETMTVAKDKINVTDKYDGYKFVGTEPEEIPDTVNNGDIIKVNYEKDTFGYTVEYYFNGVRDDTKTEALTALFEEEITTYTDKVEVGYVFDRVEGTPLIITSNPANNIIKVYYVIDDGQTKQISYTVEYYKDGVKVDEQVETTRVQILAPETMSVAKDKINVTDKYDGYKFVGTEPEEIPDTVTNGDVIKVNYEKDTFEYTVEYYFEGVRDDAKTETLTALFEEVINTYTDKVEVGYKLDVVNGIPLTITSNPTNNIIKVYYVIDEAQTKELSYKVEYYKDGVKVEEEVETTTVQVLQPETMTVAKDKINVTDKYDGYKFVGTEPEEIPDTVTNGDVIKVNYEKDTFEYTVEYYYEGVKDDGKTEVKTALFEEVIDTYTDKVEVGYKLDVVNGIPLTITSNPANNIIKVYYVIDDTQTKEISYKVEYYKDGRKADEDIKTETVQVLAEEILTVDKTAINTTDKYFGYEFVNTDPGTIPDTIVNGGVIKVNYELDSENVKELKYTVEYYKDGVVADSEEFTEVVQVLAADILTVDKTAINITDKYFGYKFVSTEPAAIPDTIANGEVIKVYYEIDEAQTKELSYKVEYYKDGTKADEETETITVQVLAPETMTVAKDKINVTDKYDGYKFVGTDPEEIPDTVTNGDVIKVNYEKDTFEYTVEYYFEGVKDDSKTEVKTALFEEVIDTYTDKVEPGYKFSNTENYPLTITSNNSANVMKVFYVIDESQTKEISYKVEYYKEGVKADENTEKETVQLLAPDTLIVDKTSINTTDKYFGYKFVGTDPEVIPDTIANGEVIKVYYEIDEAQTKELSYRVEYYKDGVKVEEEVETTTVQVLQPETMTVAKDKINVTDKYFGYEFVNTDPETIPDTIVNGGVIKVYYELDSENVKELKYTVEYYKDGVKADEEVTTKVVQILDADTLEVDKTVINTTNKYYGYKFVGTEPTTIPDVVTTGDVIKVYYEIDEAQTKELSYRVEYYKDGVKVDEQVETTTVQVLQPEIMTVEKDKINVTDKYDGYKFVGTEPEEIPDTVNNGDVIKVNYEKDTFEYTVEYYFENVRDDAKTETLTALFEEVIDTYTDKVEVGYKFDRVEGTPLTITSNPANNNIKVYYVIDDSQTKELSYKVEYYKDGVKVEEEVETTTVQVLDPETMTVAKDKINVTDKYDGYKFVGTDPEEIPDTVTNGDVIKVNYEKDTFEYTVEYYFDNVKDDDKTEVKTALFAEVIDTYTDKVEVGYKFSNTENYPLTITSDNTLNVMKVFYVTDESQTKEISYTVEYYKEGTLADSENFTERVQILAEERLTVDKAAINTTDKYFGYKFVNIDPAVIPDTIANGEVIKVYYEIDEAQTKELSYKVEYYKDGVKVEEEVETTTVQVLQPETMTVAKDKINVTDKYDGYKFVGTDPEVIPDTVTNGDVIKVNYEKDTFEYTVEYYFDGVRDDAKTETLTALFEEVINTYIDKVEVGYKLDRVEGTPLTITSNPANNIIKVYYVIDDSQTKELSYKVEYYKDGVKADEEVTTKTVQILDVEELTVNKTVINTTDKYFGYEFVNTDPVEIPDTIANGGVIKVYYELDAEHTKELKYTVEYYKDGVKVDEEVTTKVVQILEADTLEVDKTAINTNDKYDGYKFVGTDPEEIPDEVTTGTVIKVNYEKDTFEYTVEYYFDNVRDDAKTETLNALFEEVIDTYTDKVEVGYKFDRVEGTPLTITSNPVNNIIRVYYVIDETQTKELKYTVEYYKDGELSETEDFTKVVQILESDTLAVDKAAINTTDKYVGYKLENTDPEEIPDMVMNGDVIKVFYVKDSFEYRIEYYYQGVIDDSKTERNTATYQETINTYADKVINGYKLEREENLPLVVSENSENNIIRIYYIIDDGNTKELKYTVEYYKDGELSETEDFTKVVQILESDTLEVDKTAINTNDKYVGYKFVNTDPEEIPEMVNNGEVIKVFYERNDYEYTVEYYYAGIKDDSKTETLVAKYGDRIENVTDKPIEGYTLDRADNFPLVVSENAENNVIKIYYIIDNDQTKEIKYTVEYYKDGVLDEKSTQVVTKEVQVLQPSVLDVDKTQINLVDKYDGYKLDAENTVEVPNIVNDGEVIKVYYIRKDAEVVVKYYEQNSENALAEEVRIAGKVFDEYKAEAKEIEEYTLVNTTENTEGTMTEEPIVVIYYYAKESDVVVKHVDKITGEVIEEVVIPSKDGDIVETIAKDIPGYVLVETPEETTVVVEKEDIEVIYVYVKISAGVVEKHIDVKSGEILETNTYEGNEGDPYQTSPSEFEGYDLVMEQYPENESGVMTEDVIEVKYYYIRKASLKVEYIDVNTGEVIEDNTIIVEGHEGDTYTVEEKELDGYVLIEKPETEEIVLEVKPEVDEDGNVIVDTETNVIYKYAREADVVIEHIDVNTGEKLAEDEYIEGYEGKEYTTESKEIARYEVVEEPTNKDGVMKVEEVVDEETGEVTLNKTTKVVYKYDKQPAKVIVKYINKLTGEVIAEEVVDGRLDSPYETKEKEIEGYRFLSEEYPENATGVFTEETIVVNYYYMKITKVIVYYVDNVTGEIVSEEIIIDGFEGDEYTTTPADIPGYILVEDKYPENASGKHEDSEEKVYYYYVRETSVEVTYVDVETGEELAEKVIIEGAEGDSYTTEEKEIPYYVLVKVDNSDGEMKTIVTKDEETGEETVDTVTKVVYEYRKAVFDLRIEKTIAEVLVNGENRKVGNDKLVKAEIHRKKITESVVKVVYQIKVVNDGEISGSAVISDRLPEGMIFNTSDNPGWKEKGELVYRETDVLKPGESAVYEIVLYWNGTKDIGTYTNQAEIVSTQNVPEYDDKESKDDRSEASIIIVPSTGIELLVDKMLLTEFLNKGILLVYGLLIFLVIRKRKQC